MLSARESQELLPHYEHRQRCRLRHIKGVFGAIISQKGIPYVFHALRMARLGTQGKSF